MPKINHEIRNATLAGRLRTRRRELDLTQVQLAQRAGTNQAVIQKIENGKSLRPRCLQDLAKVLQDDAAWLQFGAESVSPEAMDIAKAWDRLSAADQARYRSEILKTAA